MMNDTPLRDQLKRFLDWDDAHVSFEKAVADVPKDLRGKKPDGLPYSPWQLLEHLRRAQRDILEFCRNPNYVELRFPDDYWPSSPAPESAAQWDESIRQFREDREALQQLAVDLNVDLAAEIPHGQGQTYLRELVLAADHAAYHIGQLIVVRRLLGDWK
jgi:hypothetical protein